MKLPAEERYQQISGLQDFLFSQLINPYADWSTELNSREPKGFLYIVPRAIRNFSLSTSVKTVAH